MKTVMSLLLAFAAFTVGAQNYPAPQEGTWVVRDFKFHTGEVLPELKLHYRTIGDCSGEPVIIMHGTTGQAKWWKDELAKLLQSAPRRGQ